MEHQLNVDVGTNVESFDAILAVQREPKDTKIQIVHKSEKTKIQINFSFKVEFFEGRRRRTCRRL